MTTTEVESKNKLLSVICERLNQQVVKVASDAIGELLQDVPDDAKKLLHPIACMSDFWLEQLARAACDLPSNHIGDLTCVLEECLARHVKEGAQ